MLKSILFFLLSAFAFIGLTASSLMAQVTLPNLPVGTQYQILFVSADSWLTPTDANIADYNTFVTTEANQNSTLASLGVQWHAIVSTDTVNANSNAPSSGLVYDTQKRQLTNGELYTGSIDQPTLYDQNGVAVAAPGFSKEVWTGSSGNGVEKQFGGVYYGLGNAQVEIGFTGDSDWLAVGNRPSSPVGSRSIYGLSTLITAPVTKGDFNLDGHVNAKDILPMMVALSNLNGYKANHNNLTDTQLHDIEDMDGDGQVNNADLQSLLNYLKAGFGSAGTVPEPASFILLSLASAGLLLRRRR